MFLNEKEKDRQEENACSAFNRVSPRLSGPKETSRPTCRGLGCAGGVVSTPGAGRRGRLGRDTGLTALCQACGGRRPLRGRLYLEIPERAERGTPRGEQEEPSLLGADLGKTRASCRIHSPRGPCRLAQKGPEDWDEGSSDRKDTSRSGPRALRNPTPDACQGHAGWPGPASSPSLTLGLI